ncbi:hypothetical protein DQ384_38175 [Sphaerisporangium album]|uniref:Uncharacterized protein n=1 Tax=Sphaerisporangium album TaxID=509200 RepID=A0A367EMW7_9ACTN|nr:hypothetical protein [Sphaerisporangium album]RCG19109.1 hypothetical protein DQ384_38175 [Sphaerisporangium album]
MPYAVPTPSEMFSDATSGAEVAQRFETYKSALSTQHARAQSGAEVFMPGVGIVADAGRQAELVGARVEAITKGLSADALAAVQGELDALKAVTADIGKDWTLTNPNSTGLVPYDLEAPAKLLVPRATPLRNSLPRSKGQGTARQFKRILGWSNSGTGGVADQMAFMDSGSISTAFGPVNLRRGAKIAYTSDSKSVAYVEQGLSDSVIWKAQFAGQGFQDIRSLSQTALLWATLGAEERGILLGRGASGNGYAGAISAPVISITSSANGGAVAAGTYYVKVTARGGGGESVVSNEVNTGALSGGANQFTVTVATEPTGALGYNLYVGTASGAETFVTSFAGNTITVLTTPVTGGAAMPVSDGTANANGYDGFLTVQADPAVSGYFKRHNASIATTGDEFLQAAFIGMYGANAIGNADRRLADPDEVWLDGQIRKVLGDYLKKTATSSAYRIALTESDAAGGATIGSVVNAIANQVTGKMVDLQVHPYMPLGCVLIRSRSLPVPDSEVSNTSEIVNVQDYMAIDWPVIQYTYDSSTYMYGSLVHYAPGWSGLVVGVLP